MSLKDSEGFAERMKTFARNLANKHREHAKKREQAADLYGSRVFALAPFEMQTLSRWRTEHSKTCKLMWNEDGTPIIFPGGANGGLITYHFTDTNLGQVQKASCGCGEEVDLTDYEEW